MTLTAGPIRVTAAARTAERFAGLLADLLGVERVPVDGHVFDDLGADSMVMARFCARVRKQEDLPPVSMRDVYAQPTLAALAASLVAAPDAELTTSPEPTTRHARPARASTAAYVGCGAVQLSAALLWFYLLGLALSGSLAFVADAEGWAETYLRAVLGPGGTLVGLSLLPIVAKWVLVGRWQVGEIRIWSPAHARFWVVATLVRTSPLALYTGSPLYNLYLRALGAKVGRGALLLSRHVPVVTDLLTVGAGAVVRKDTWFTGYHAESGTIRTGPVHVGAGAMVGERCVLEVGSSLGDRSQLGHASSLRADQPLPAGMRRHGSPAEEATAIDLRSLETPCGRGRRTAYGAGQALLAVLVVAPLVVAGPLLVAQELPRLTSLLSIDPTTWAWGSLVVDAAATSAVLFFGAVLLGLVVVGTVPRLLSRAVRPGRSYPLYGFRYWAHRTIGRLTNVPFYPHLFGDSSYVVPYLRWVGYDLSRVEQTGSNFGLEVQHDSPFHVTVGTGTMVADGLSVANADYSSTSFRVSPVTIGPRTFVGNYVVVPSQARLGDDVLLATKVAVPVGPTAHHGVGLLGSPSFEIPRTVLRDSRVDQALGPTERRRRLAAKNRHNALTIGLYLMVQWLNVLGLLLVAAVATRLYGVLGAAGVAVAGVLAVVGSTLWFALVERASTGFRRLEPHHCSIYDPYFWWHERYWKLSTQPFLLAGTAFAGPAWRLLGVRIGRRVYDDGTLIMEKTMVTVGDDAVLNAGSIVQPHSQEDGSFKSDRISIGPQATIGTGALVHYGVTVGADAVLAPDSFLMKGEDVPDGARWGMNPARDLSRVSPIGASS